MKSPFGLGLGVVACLASAAILSTAGCSSAPKPTAVSGNIEASVGLNPSVTQRPSPLLLRIYELKSAAAFNQADFMSLYQADQGTLGAELVTREEVMLQPGETRPFAKKLSVDTRFIGVVAAYRNLEQATWRSITAVQPGRSQKITIRADPLSVSATVSP
jgi:type VI secretion system protein VasD